MQSWFDTNRVNDREHNHVHLRGQLKEYDPALAALMAEVFGDKEWRYTRPTERRDLPHLRDYDPAKLATFAWPGKTQTQSDEWNAKLCYAVRISLTDEWSGWGRSRAAIYNFHPV